MLTVFMILVALALVGIAPALLPLHVENPDSRCESGEEEGSLDSRKS